MEKGKFSNDKEFCVAEIHVSCQENQFDTSVSNSYKAIPSSPPKCMLHLLPSPPSKQNWAYEGEE